MKVQKYRSKAAATPPSLDLRRALRLALSLATAFAIAATGSGCTNNLLSSATNLLKSTEITSTPNGGIGSITNNSGVVLSRVQKNSLNPTTTLDLLGDGTGAIGQSCQAKSGTATGATTCQCAYTYITTSGAQVGPVNVDSTYRENDMIRCPYSVVPTDTSYFTISIYLSNVDAHSNEITFKQNGSGVTLDLANSSSFLQVQRYQCRDIVSVPYLWDTSIYDPFLSEDARISYPLNFYTTNMGRTMAVYAGGSGTYNIAAPTQWNCPQIPNDTTAGMDLTLYSLSTDSTGSKSIYPPTGAFDRSTFFVAKASSAPFNVAVNAYAMPTVLTAVQPAAGSGGNGTLPPLGYAARPIPISSGGETCPDTSTTIPKNFHWAKLWLFRKQLPQRTYPTSTNLLKLNNIYCNSVPWQVSTPAAPNDTLFTDCSGARNVSNLDPTTGLAARFFSGTSMCMKPNPGGATDPVSKKNFTIGQSGSPNGSVDFTAYAEGTDTYTPSSKDPVHGCFGTSPIDPTHVCTNSTGNVAYDASYPVAQGAIDTTALGSRFDYLFVVSPVSVNRQDFVSGTASSVAQTYTPARFMSPNDCQSGDPDLPAFAGDCSTSRILKYDIKKHEVGSPGNPGQDDANRPGDFPMCVLQPD